MIKNYRYDYFLIWGHGQEYRDEIINIISKTNNVEIVRIENHYPKNIKKLVKAIYSYDYAPFHHLKAKTEYLLNTPNNTTFIFVKNNLVKEVYTGEGSFEHIESPRIVNIKKEIRARFNPKKEGKITEDHVIHASDSEEQVDYILKYLGYKRGINTFSYSNAIIKAPYHLQKFDRIRIQNVATDKLRCNILSGNVKEACTSVIPLKKSPHYAFLAGKEEVYKKYLEKYKGEQLKDFYSIDKFKNLAMNLDYQKSNRYIIVKSLKDSYQILDGVHRASILMYNGHNYLPVAISQ